MVDSLIMPDPSAFDGLRASSDNASTHPEEQFVHGDCHGHHRGFSEAALFGLE